MVRTYDRTHREAQARETRRAILDAAFALTAEDDGALFTFARVAERAGVSEPTVYRNFANREALIGALSDHVATKLRSPAMPADADDLPAAALAATRYFAENSVTLRAAIQTSGASREVREHGRKGRVARLREVVAQRTQHLEKADAEAIHGVFITLMRAESWIELTDRQGVDHGRAGLAIAWALRAFLDALTRDAKRGVQTLADEKLSEKAERMRAEPAQAVEVTESRRKR